MQDACKTSAATQQTDCFATEISFADNAVTIDSGVRQVVIFVPR